jgi:hypothetical protein
MVCSTHFVLARRIGGLPSQSVDQAAYRKGFSTEDHLLAVTLIIEKSWEYNYPIWFALVDFEKAFDMVEHGPL